MSLFWPASKANFGTGHIKTLLVPMENVAALWAAQAISTAPVLTRASEWRDLMCVLQGTKATPVS